MTTKAPQPTIGRVVSILWFPFFLAVAMTTLFLAPLANPAPRAMHIGVEGGPSAVDQLQAALDEVESGGFHVTALSADETDEAVEDGRVAAAVVGGTDPSVLVASDTSATRVAYLEGVLVPVVGGELQDISPSAAGDVTGTGVFFYGLPIAIVGIVTAIVLLQLGAWPMRRKLLAIVAIGGFTAVVTYAIAVWQQVVSFTGTSALLVIGTFVFIQGVAWTFTGAAVFLHQYLVPTALTFVLVLGVPTAGAPASPDMLPRVLGVLHEVMPLGQFITLVRSLAYGVGSPLHPWLVLVAWWLIGAALCALAHRRLERSEVAAAPEPVAAGGHVTLQGTVSSLSGAPVPRATVWVLTEDGSSALHTTTDSLGRYRVPEVTKGLHHVLVTASNAEPEIVTVDVRRHGHDTHDFMLELWDDPAVNLTAEVMGEHVR